MVTILSLHMYADALFKIKRNKLKENRSKLKSTAGHMVGPAIVAAC